MGEVDVEGFPSQMMGLGPIDGAQIPDRRFFEPREVGETNGRTRNVDVRARFLPQVEEEPQGSAGGVVPRGNVKQSLHDV